MSDEMSEEIPLAWEDVSVRTDAVNNILSTLRCPAQVRNLITVLLGISEGHVEFETFHKKIAARMRVKEGGQADENAMKAVQRAHGKLVEWQTANNLNLVEYISGTRTKEGGVYKNNPSKYYLHIIQMADEVIALAKTVSGINTSNKIQRAARNLYHSYSPKPIYIHEKPYPAQNKEVERNLNMAKTYIRKAIEIIERENYFVLLSEDTVKEFEDAISKLRKTPLDFLKGLATTSEGDGGQ